MERDLQRLIRHMENRPWSRGDIPMKLSLLILPHSHVVRLRTRGSIRIEY